MRLACPDALTASAVVRHHPLIVPGGQAELELDTLVPLGILLEHRSVTPPDDERDDACDAATGRPTYVGTALVGEPLDLVLGEVLCAAIPLVTLPLDGLGRRGSCHVDPDHQHGRSQDGCRELLQSPADRLTFVPVHLHTPEC